MALLDQALGFIDWMGWYILPFIAIMSAIVFFHELGHYAVGRWCGVKIEAFSLGFGPELFARVDSRGTRWRLGAFPLGGYVKFWGDADAASTPDGAADRDAEPGGAAPHARRSTATQPGGDRRRRTDRQFHSGVRFVHRAVHGFWSFRA